MNTPILDVKDVTISFFKEKQERPVIKNSTFHIHQNEIVAIVGESGSGKSITSLAIMGLLPQQIAKITSGTITFDGMDITNTSKKEYQAIRGNAIAMIFQEPMSALNPSMPCGKQVFEVLKQHTSASKSEITTKVLSLFQQVHLPNPKRIYKAYPHQISGGQKQRVMIAMAIACKPKLLIADEPTTALDVTVQKEILELLKSIQKETKMSVLFISHDLSVVSHLANRVLVMYKGEIVEQGTTYNIFNQPQHRYTQALIGARPSTTQRLKILPTVADFMKNTLSHDIITKSQRSSKHKILYNSPPLLEVQHVVKTYRIKQGWFKAPKAVKAVDGVTFKIYPGETVGLVGESGCGKSTLGNAILQLDNATSGHIIYRGKDITNLNSKAIRRLRKEIQIIFQDPFASLNPRLTVGNAISEPLKIHGIIPSPKARKLQVISIFESVGLSASDYSKYPHEFSGGQRQRIGIARAIALQPQLIVCDESVSALDISVQAQILNLLNSLKEQYQFSYLFISHDLAVVKYMADQLLVMHKGKIIEQGDADIIYSQPQNNYTKALIEAIPKDF